MAWTWHTVDPAGLARLVSPEAATWLRVPDEVVPGRWRQGPGERRRLLRGLYEVLADHDLRHVPELFDPEAEVQPVRTPRELLRGSGEGSCLDLAALWCGACAGYGLLPVLIVLEDHVLAAVSLGHRLESWDAPGRSERALFADGPLTDGGALRSLVEDGGYLALECTGFARSAAPAVGQAEEAVRPDGSPVGFDAAVRAGREQLGRGEDRLRFALDLGTARNGWDDRSPPAWTVHGERMTDRHRAVFGGQGGVLLMPSGGPVDVRPRRPELPAPPRPFVDREEELATAATAAEGDSVGIRGPTGSGKTALLRTLAHHLRSRGGVVHLTAASRSHAEVLQDLFEQLFDAERPYQISEGRLAELLEERGPFVVVVDGPGVSRDDLDRLVKLVPDGGVAWASAGPPRGELARVVTLGGLGEDDALALIEQRLGRPVRAVERSAAIEFVHGVGGNPRTILQAAARVAAGAVSFPALIEVLAERGDLRPVLLDPLDPEARRLLEVLALVSPATLDAAHLAEIAGLDQGRVGGRLAELGELHLVGSQSSRHSVPADLAGWLERHADLDPLRQQALDHFEGWARSHDGDPGPLAAEADACLVLARWGLDRRRPGQVLRLTQVLEGALAVRGRWGAWEQLLHLAGDAAYMVDDAPVRAWTLHQLGSRALCLDRVEEARGHLREALRERRGLGDERGAAVTAHNLALVPEATVPVTDAPPVVDDVQSEEPEAAPVVAPEPPDRGRRAERRSRRGWPVFSSLRTFLLVASGALGIVLVALVALRAGPPLAVRPGTIAFGTVTLEGTAHRAVSVENTGETVVPVRGVDLEGADAFRIDEESCSDRRLDPGATCVVTVAYRPTSEGTHRSTLRIEHDGGEVAVAVVGQGTSQPTPLPSVRPDPLRFGEIGVGTRATRSVLVHNEGDAPLVVEGIGVEPGAFRVVEADDCTAAPVEPGDRCRAEIAFAPTAAGSVSGTLTLQHEGGSLEAAVSGSGVSGELVFQPSLVDFGEVSVGSTERRELTVANRGEVPVSMGQLETGDAPAFALGRDGCSGSTLEPEDECRVVVAFEPSGPGTHEAALAVPHDTTGPGEVGLVGVGASSEEVARPRADAPTTGEGTGGSDDAAARSRLAFGRVPVGTTSRGVIRFGNSGDAPLTIGRARLRTSDAYAILESRDECSGTTLAPGGECQLTVAFAPPRVGSHTGVLMIPHGDTTTRIDLAGEGVPARPVRATVVGVDREGDSFAGDPPAPGGGRYRYDGNDAFRLGGQDIGMAAFEGLLTGGGGGVGDVVEVTYAPGEASIFRVVLDRVPSPSAVRVDPEQGGVTVSWEQSAQPDAVYNVFRETGGALEQIATEVTGTSVRDDPPSGVHRYLVEGVGGRSGETSERVASDEVAVSETGGEPVEGAETPEDDDPGTPSPTFTPPGTLTAPPAPSDRRRRP